MHPRRKGDLGWLGIFVSLLLPGCASAPARQITAAPLTRYGQAFETTVIAATTEDCVVRTRLPEPYSASAWIEIRNSAVHAALNAATACCAQPRVLRIEDWMAGFAAWEIRFSCAGDGSRNPRN
jgi:hypothetical protein